MNIYLQYYTYGIIHSIPSFYVMYFMHLLIAGYDLLRVLWVSDVKSYLPNISTATFAFSCYFVQNICPFIFRVGFSKSESLVGSIDCSFTFQSLLPAANQVQHLPSISSWLPDPGSFEAHPLYDIHQKSSCLCASRAIWFTLLCLSSLRHQSITHQHKGEYTISSFKRNHIHRTLL